MYMTFLHLSVGKKVDWLAGCEAANKLCWACLLFLQRNKCEGFLGFKCFVKCAAKTLKP